jgi:lysophospholipase L1-like esterase
MIWKTLAALALGVLSACGNVNITVQTTTLPSQSKPLSNVVAFMGDSITHRWDLAQYDPNPTLNFGVDADTTVQMLARFGDVVAAAPGVVVILGGTNDLQVFGPSAANTDSIEAMASMAKAAGIRVILCSVMPTTNFQYATLHFTLADIRAFNDSLIRIAQANGYLYADYYDEFLNADGTVNNSLYIDGLHPNASGYAKMWTIVAPLIDEDLQ